MGWIQHILWDIVEHAHAGLDRLARWRGHTPELPAHLETGFSGEEAAFFHLSRKGYQVVAKRWSSGNTPGDLDLVAWQGPVLCFFEVKTRTAHDIAAAEVAVDRVKRRVLRRLAQSYVRQLSRPVPPPVRFDIVSVYLVPGEHVEIVHFENAFGWNENRQNRE